MRLMHSLGFSHLPALLHDCSAGASAASCLPERHGKPAGHNLWFSSSLCSGQGRGHAKHENMYAYSFFACGTWDDVS